MCCNKKRLEMRFSERLNVASCAQVEVNLDVLETQEPILVNGVCYYYENKRYNGYKGYRKMGFSMDSPNYGSIPSDANGAQFDSAYIADRFLLHKCQDMYVFILLQHESSRPWRGFRSGFFMG